jgi:sulfatase maturation enzyme AslB (radical SAM superfamily)
MQWYHVKHKQLIRMVGFNNDIKVLHLEATTVCNAKCPQCARENPELYNDDIDRAELTLDKCKELFSLDFINNLDKMFMCGDFGDPVAAKDTLKILKYFKTINPTIVLGLNTNGSIQNTSWWTELALVLDNPRDYAIFSIDGLKDTNHIYRKNVRWSKVIENAKAFIDAGGSAHWDMLVFKHNEHQLLDAENLARELGFSFFRSKVSRRFETHPVDGIDAPTTFDLPNMNTTHEIKCHALHEKSLYVSATGEKLPCCWIGVNIFNMDSYLRSLLKSDNWNKLTKSWNNAPHATCSKACGVNNTKKTNFESQWTKEIKLR